MLIGAGWKERKMHLFGYVCQFFFKMLNGMRTVPKLLGHYLNLFKSLMLILKLLPILIEIFTSGKVGDAGAACKPVWLRHKYS